MIKLELPWPPALNRYYRNVKGRVLISRDGREYRKTVQRHLLTVDRRAMPILGRLRVNIAAYPPDRRRRDVDGMLKAMLDAMTHAGVWGDDSQIDMLVVERRYKIDGGLMVVSVSNMA